MSEMKNNSQQGAQQQSAQPDAHRNLVADGVTVQRAGRTILRNVSMQAQAGRVMVLVGPNGAGKSTLLAALAGDDTPVQGGVSFGDTDMANLSVSQLARLRSVLTQSQPVSVPFTASEVIDFGRAPWGAADDRLRNQVIDECDVRHLLDRPVTVLSGGERARVHCARVLLQDTPVLLLDEPTAALDLSHAEAILSVARRRARDGAVVVVVLHDLSAAAAHADDIVVLADGEIVAEGSPAEVLTEQLVSEIYGLDVEVLYDSSGNPVIVPAR